MVEDLHQKTINEALAHHGSGDLGRADQLYRKVLSRDPQHPAALHFLGVIALQRGHPENAIELISQAVSVAPDYADAHSNLGNALQSTGRFEDAVKSYEIALAVNPRMPETRANLGNARSQLRQFEAAAADYGLALASKPDLPEAQRNLALALLALDQPGEALKSIIKAKTLSPNSLEITLSMGNILLQLGRADDAIDCYNQILRVRPDSPHVLCNLGNVLRQNGRLDEAVSCYEQALSTHPDYAEAHYNRGVAYNDAGDPESAISCFRHALTLDKHYGKAHRMLASLTRHSDHDEDMVAMEIAIGDTAVNDEQKMHLAFGLGKSFEDLGLYPKAFNYYQTANSLRRQSISFDIEKEAEVFDNIKAAFSEDFMTSYPDKTTPLANAMPTPIFIVGMPRSGTTLVEQILASHPMVFGAGELNTLPLCIADHMKMLSGIDYTADLHDTDPETLQSIAVDYLGKLQALAPGSPLISDKLPMNFLNIGLIRLLMPGAHIIHCTRSPVDTCLSIYKNFFPDRGHHYGYELSELGRYYNLYRDLMDHWRQVVSFHDISYERLVGNQEDESRRLLEACSLEWDSACMDFHTTKRQVSTISAAQVRKPIYGDSIELWRCYETDLAPLIATLDSP